MTQKNECEALVAWCQDAARATARTYFIAASEIASDAPSEHWENLWTEAMNSLKRTSAAPMAGAAGTVVDDIKEMLFSIELDAFKAELDRLNAAGAARAVRQAQ
ncbi:MAG: hypothetical protein C3F11_03670 [Methylocystaceae bacterium]|nr:MAG: hypothetical protein C3F11_03670 [Methylocystaceae bacterium]